MCTTTRVILPLLAWLVWSAPSAAQSPPSPLAPVARPASSDTAMLASNAEQSERTPSVTRSDDGRVTVRAVRLREPLVLDGRLDDAIYKSTPPDVDRPPGDYQVHTPRPLLRDGRRSAAALAVPENRYSVNPFPLPMLGALPL